MFEIDRQIQKHMALHYTGLLLSHDLIFCYSGYMKTFTSLLPPD